MDDDKQITPEPPESTKVNIFKAGLHIVAWAQQGKQSWLKIAILTVAGLAGGGWLLYSLTNYASKTPH